MAHWQAREHDARVQAIRSMLVWKYRAIVAVTDAGLLRRHGVRHRDSGIPPGWPDLVAVLDGGRTVFVEVKTGEAKLSASQSEMADQMAKRGHTYVIARNVDDAIAAVEATA